MDAPSENGPVKRLAEETRALVDDLKEWTDVRVQLLQVEVEERVQSAANEVLMQTLVIMLMAGGMLFVALAAAFGIGEWLGSPAWGLLIVGACFVLLAASVRSTKPDLASRMTRITDDRKSTSQADEEPPKGSQGALPEQTHGE